MGWWGRPLLNEGFASWMEKLRPDHYFRNGRCGTEFASGDVAYAMGLDGPANTHPIQVYVDDSGSVDEIFRYGILPKGSSIINMLQHYVGGKSFRRLQIILRTQLCTHHGRAMAGY